MTEARQWIAENRHLVLAYSWIALGIPGILWWKESVLFVILLSLYANFEASLAAHHAKRQDRDTKGGKDQVTVT